MKWPKEVPILTANDIYQGGRYHSKSQKTSCLLGWSHTVFGNEYAIYDVLVKRLPSSCLFITDYSDHSSRKDVAKLWNKTMADLGYTEGNPEAK